MADATVHEMCADAWVSATAFPLQLPEALRLYREKTVVGETLVEREIITTCVYRLLISSDRVVEEFLPPQLIFQETNSLAQRWQYYSAGMFPLSKTPEEAMPRRRQDLINRACVCHCFPDGKLAKMTWTLEIEHELGLLKRPDYK